MDMRITGWWGAGAAFGVAAFLGCAHGNQQSGAMEHIDNSSLTKLNEQQMQPVDDARIEQGRAADALARAKANEKEAHTRVEVAKAERDVAVAQLNRAKAEHDLLMQQKAAPSDQARAAESQKTAEERVKASDLKIDYLNKMIGVSAQETELAEKHAEVTAALTERAKFQVLQSTDPNQLQGVNGPKIEAQLANLQLQEANLRKQTADKRVAAVDSYNQWQELDAKVRTEAATTPNTPPPPMNAQPANSQPVNTAQQPQQPQTVPPPLSQPQQQPVPPPANAQPSPNP